MPIRRLFASGLTLVVILALSPIAPPKCISLQITLGGEIQGIAADLAVSVEVKSAAKGDPATDVRQESSIEKGQFRLRAWFNTQSNVVSRERCDRLPQIVTVKLMSGNRILDHRTLKIESDFRRTSDGDYELKRPIMLKIPVEK